MLLAPLPAQAACCLCGAPGGSPLSNPPLYLPGHTARSSEINPASIDVCFDNTSDSICFDIQYLRTDTAGTARRNCVWVTDASCSSICASADVNSPQKLQDKTMDILDVEYYKPRDPIKFKPNVTIPGTDFKAREPMTIEPDTIAEYIAGLYYFIIASIGILAVVGIMVGGFQYLMAAGSPEKITEAKHSITGAIIGLIIALTSYLLFATINPNLVDFSRGIIGLSDKEKLNYDRYTQLIGTNPGTCTVDLQSLKGALPSRVELTPAAEALKPEAVVALRQAVADGTPFANWLDEPAHPKKLVITSAYRTMQRQMELRACYDYSWNKDKRYCPYNCSSCEQAANASCDAPHQTGYAVDVCIRSLNNTQQNNAACNLLKSWFNNSDNAPDGSDYKTKLQTFMQQANFGRYCCEWWHFEAPQLVQQKGGPNAPRYCQPGVYSGCTTSDTGDGTP